MVDALRTNLNEWNSQMNEEKSQPAVLIKAMREVAYRRMEYDDQKMVELIIQTWQQRAEIEGLKRDKQELVERLSEMVEQGKA